MSAFDGVLSAVFATRATKMYIAEHAGRIRVLDLLPPMPCPAGLTGPGDGRCTQCVAGTFKAVTGSTPCQPCQPGAYSATNASASCTLCVAGKFSTGWGSTGCNMCPALTDAPAGSETLTNCTCVVGYTGPPEGPCVACASGRFKESLGSAPCAPCAAGKYSALNASSACISCAGGKFLARTGAATADACEECAGDSHSQPGSDTATACVCNMGYTGPDGGPCTACAVNTYKDITGSASCSRSCRFSSRDSSGT